MKFRYEAKDGGGEAVRGEIEANVEREAAARLRERGLTPIDIVPACPSRSGAGTSPSFFMRGGVPLAEKALFFRELAAMTGAGISASSALRVLSGQKRSRRFDGVIARIYAEVSSGSTIAGAFAGHPSCFDAVTVALIRAGEESGTLDASLARLAAFLEARAELRKKLVSALTYPALVVLVAAASLCVLTAVVVPQFERAFRGLGVELPPLTRAVFAAGSWMEAYWYIPLIALAAALLAARLSLRAPGLRAAADGALLKMPVFGDMLLKASLARSFGTMAALLRSGLPVLQSLRLAASAAGNEKIRKAIETAREDAASGKSLSASLGARGIFPPMIVQMAAVGEETGRTGEMLEKIAGWYESELTEKVKRLGSILEPVMVVIVGGLVGLIAVAVFMPIVSAINSFI